MTGEKTMNRWWVVAGALVIQVSLGAVYIWSVFQTPLKSVYQDWSETQVTLPAQIVLAAFALAVILAGRIQDRVGPRIVATAGGIILGAGLILAKFTELFPSGTALVWLIATFSILGGVGIGAGYVCPIATCVKWFPDKRGLITGLAVAGFGAGAFFFAPLAKALISGGAYELLGAKLFTLPQIGIFNTFLILGIIFLVCVVAGAQLLRNPPPGYVPAGWVPPQAKTPAAAASKTECSPMDMVRTPAFWLLWVTYFIACSGGLQIIMKASPIWQSFSLGSMTPPISAVDFGLTATAAAMAVSIIAIFNSAGRIAWGVISDKIGRKVTLVVIFVLCGVALLILDWLHAYPFYLAMVSLIGLCFGGFLALYPALTADYFGTKHIGVNYGVMFTAYGAGGIAGPYLAASLMRVVDKVTYEVTDAAGTIAEKFFTVGDYRLAFVAAGIACLVAAGLVTLIRPPARGK
ncbi:MAG: OFA family MFS transporter [Anaerolineales bacterium]|nr:OFA family MFS transporter [Anaerolineales bacterium]